MKIILSESQVDQTVLKFCEISFEEIKNMCENMFSYDSWPSYLSLNTCLEYGSISVIDFFNVRSSKDDKKIIGEKIDPTCIKFKGAKNDPINTKLQVQIKYFIG